MSTPSMRDAPALDVPEARQQLRHGGLPRPGGPHQRDRLPRREVEGEAAQYRLVGFVRKGHILEANPLAHAGQPPGARPVLDRHRLVDHPEDALRGSHGTLHRQVHLVETLDGVVERVEADQERDQRAKGHGPGVDELLGVPHEHQNATGAEHFHDWGVQGEDLARLQVGLEVTPRGLPEASRLEGLHTERLHDAEPLEHLVHHGVHVTQPLLALVRAVAQLASEVHDRPEQQRRQHEGREGEAEVQREDQDQEADHREEVLQEVGEAVGDRVGDLLHVVGDA